MPHQTTNNADQVKPFLKWAGGKRWFMRNHYNFFPKEYIRYIEPFLGGGAVFFHLSPERGVLSDTNSELISTYAAIRDEWQLVLRYLKDHHRLHSTQHYYAIRSSIPRSQAARAARFIYLNRTCWNGLYRVNRKGMFNVPIGTKKDVIYEDDCFERVSKLLKNMDLLISDFESVIDSSHDGDLIFVDPPYTVSHNNNGFIKYNEKLFTWEDQKRLSGALIRAQSRGAFVVATNACHRSVENLYCNHFQTYTVSRTSLISSNPSTRKKFNELVITSS